MTDIQLNRYFEMIHRRVPIKVSGSIRWLRKPSSFAVRLVVAFLLILGGVFSFLPLLGIWMLPLGLMLIAQDVPFLQKPLVQSLAWVEAKLKWLKRKTSKEIVLRQRAFIDALLQSEKDSRMRLLPACAALMKKGQPSPLAIRARARVE